MKKKLKSIVILITIIVLMPLTIVNADSSKTEIVLEKLNSADFLKAVNGTAKYENDTIEIEYYISNSTTRDFSFLYEDNVIEYNPGELTCYDDAVEASSHYMYASKLIYSALKLNGYTQDQIKEYMQSEDSNPTFEVNGFEFNQLGETQKFEDDNDGYSGSIQIVPMSIKIDVSKANLNLSSSDEIEEMKTTVEDVVNDLKSDDSFTIYKYDDGRVVYENEIAFEDDRITIVYTEYTYDYHNIYFDCVDDVLTFEAEEIESYEEANSVSEHEMWAMILLQYALEINGYTDEEIKEFFSSENSNPTFEKNGIEIKKLGESKEFTGEMDDTTSVTPISIKIDFSKVNIDKEVKEYEIVYGENQTFDKINDGKLFFEFSMDYDIFVEKGKIFIDGNEVSRNNYSLSKGSTIVTFNDDFTNNLSEGEHTIIASLADGSAQANFTIVETEDATQNKTETNETNETNEANETNTSISTNTTNNPKTGDDIITYILSFVISLAGIIIISLKAKKIIR